MKRITLFVVLACAALFMTVLLSGAMPLTQEKSKSSSSSSEKKGWLGVSIQDITSQMEKAMDLKSRDGALVSDVARKSPAESGGIKEGDIIVQFGGKNIQDTDDLQKAVADTKPETKVSVVLNRKGEKKTLDVVVGSSPERRVAVSVSPRPFGNFEMFGAARNIQGMSLRELNDQMGQYFGVTEGSGALVWEVEKGSPAEKAGVKAGDVITVIGKKKIRELRDVQRALGIYDDGEKAEVEVMRKGSKQTLSLEVKESENEPGYQFWFNTPRTPRHREGSMFEGYEFNVPDVHIETIRPDMDKLRSEMEQFRNQWKVDSKELREKIQREVNSHIHLHNMEEI